MPKSRKARGKKQMDKDKSTSMADGDQEVIEPGDGPRHSENNHEPIISDINETELELQDGHKGKELDNLSESDLKAELQTELKRLQEEYKRQKQLTAELERERSRAQFELSADNAPPIEVASISPDSSKKTQDYPDIYFDQSMEQTLFSDLEIEKRFSETINNIRSELVALSDNLNNKLDEDAITDLKASQNLVEELSQSISKFNQEVKKVQKEIQKTDEKLDSVLLDLGFDESLDINKIPNYILVMVYETILNDIIIKITNILGVQDTEESVNKILENVRSHTSGGELFKYDHNKIKIPELRQYLDKKMISPKQIHITFNSIVNKLVEYTPGYSPKNFKAMIKIMSQEYAVDSAIKIQRRFEELSSEMNEMKGNINKFLANYKDQVEAQQSNQGEMENLSSQIIKLSDRVNDLPGILEKTLDDKIEERLNSKLTEFSIPSKGPEGKGSDDKSSKLDVIEEQKEVADAGNGLGPELKATIAEKTEKSRDVENEKIESEEKQETTDILDNEQKEVEPKDNEDVEKSEITFSGGIYVIEDKSELENEQEPGDGIESEESEKRLGKDEPEMIIKDEKEIIAEDKDKDKNRDKHKEKEKKSDKKKSKSDDELGSSSKGKKGKKK
jgi:hypothetical protein